MKNFESQQETNRKYYDRVEFYERMFKKSEDGAKFKRLMDRIKHPDNIMLAYRSIKSNSGANTASVDKMTMRDIKKLSTNEVIREIHRRLEWYEPDITRRVFIPKANGDLRPIGIPSIWDRLIQQAILQVLEPICEAKFNPHSYGFRPHRSAEHAIADVAFKINIQHYHYVIDVDIKSFFDEIDHDILLRLMWNMGIQDKKLLSIVKKMLEGVVEQPDGAQVKATKGSPQGGVLSPLLANIYLNALDWWISDQWETFRTRKNYTRIRANNTVDQSGKYRALRTSSNLKELMIVRYADDFKIFTNSKASADKILIAVSKWLHERLKLNVSPLKSGVTCLRQQSTEFLGFTLKLMRKGRMRTGMQRYVMASDVCPKALSRIQQNLSAQVKSIQRASNSKRGIDEVLKYNSIVVGIHNYYGIATNVNDSFQRISLGLLRKMYNRLNRNNQNDNFSRSGRYEGEDVRITKYMSSKSMRYYMGYPVIPLSYVQHKSPMMLKKDYRQTDSINDAHVRTELVKLRSNAHYNNRRSIEYMDNRIAKYLVQRGKCAVTGVLLFADEVTCHHIESYAATQDDSYKNLVIIQELIHRLIHATQLSTIKRYLRALKLSKSELTHVNNYRTILGHDIL
ncbi:group II intron reverse transcriptase/maturase [Paenibacillus amylolyticus]|uniref:group II intron reverse transcriptase/maturase n=1 Tax=Paenibacillus amylolyticus TaxID=1451 RepID=UPI00201E16D3|nr:group II intron reverse transcriptase/maturase [Paenibacillus amylolyticus]MCL6663433.1 group II intron reverse transcriptase/maturase [Paenibacillus amylolyticus]